MKLKRIFYVFWIIQWPLHILTVAFCEVVLVVYAWFMSNTIWLYFTDDYAKKSKTGLPIYTDKAPKIWRWSMKFWKIKKY